MKILTKEDVLNNWKYFEKALLISSIKGETDLTDIRKRVGYKNETNGYFNAMVKFLSDNDFLDIDDTRKPYVIKIKNNKLIEFLSGQGHIYDMIDLYIRLRNPSGIYRW